MTLKKNMVIKFTNIFVDLSYLGCKMFFKKGKKKLNALKRANFVIILTQKYTKVLGENSVLFFLQKEVREGYN